MTDGQKNARLREVKLAVDLAVSAEAVSQHRERMSHISCSATFAIFTMKMFAPCTDSGLRE